MLILPAKKARVLETTNGAGTRLYTSGTQEALQTLESTNICTSELIGSKQ